MVGTEAEHETPGAKESGIGPWPGRELEELGQASWSVKASREERNMVTESYVLRWEAASRHQEER